MSLWTTKEIALITRGQYSGEDAAINGISIDTRHITKGDLFIALTGPNFDGNEFAEDALAKGAAAVITTKSGNPNFITVSDTLLALQDLGQGARARSTAAIIAVTGSVGKTSVKAMLATVFSSLGKTHASDASLNNHWGVPLSLARMPTDAEYAIFEIGMNHANEISPLSKMVAPHVAIITTIASAHIQYLGSIENIAIAKAEIFHGMDADGVAILPRDSEQFPILLAEARTQGLHKIKSFGQSHDADIRLLSLDENKLTASLNGKEFTFDFNVPGIHQAVNALSVVATVDALRGDLKKVQQAFAELSPVAGRGNRQEVILNDKNKPLVIVNETHNASPVAVNAALDVLKNMATKNRRIVVLGDMLELGPNSPKFHAELASKVLESNPDLILLSGPMMKNLADILPKDKTHHYADSATLSKEIVTLVQAGDVVLIKGSRGSKMKLVVDALTELGQS
jgi:UDP-N-acetylmuramoyl-tripeptide--D-alanyl-D-alanine ligase